MKDSLLDPFLARSMGCCPLPGLMCGSSGSGQQSGHLVGLDGVGARGKSKGLIDFLGRKAEGGRDLLHAGTVILQRLDLPGGGKVDGIGGERCLQFRLPAELAAAVALACGRLETSVECVLLFKPLIENVLIVDSRAPIQDQP